jgi:hypothetical protein
MKVLNYYFTFTKLYIFILVGLIIYFGVPLIRSLTIFEGFESASNTEARCPNLLIQYGASFYLYNSSLARVPGVNPVQFSNLEEYTEFLEWQKSQNIRCPVLYLRNTYDADGTEVFRVAPSVFEPQNGLPETIVTTNSRASALNLEHTFAPRNLVNPQDNNLQFTDSLFSSV